MLEGSAVQGLTKRSARSKFREVLAGSSEQSFAARARRRRWETVLQHFPDLVNFRILDLGGTPQFWLAAPVRPVHVTVMNPEPPGAMAPWITVIDGDACNAASVVGREPFDMVFSNSTIEHVGGHERCVAFARSVRELAPRHWVQTPYRYFPLEPHFLFPGFQFLPVAVRQHILARWPLSYSRAAGGVIDDPVGVVLGTELLGRTQFQYYFPDSTILSERVVGVTKSLIAIKS